MKICVGVKLWGSVHYRECGVSRCRNIEYSGKDRKAAWLENRCGAVLRRRPP